MNATTQPTRLSGSTMDLIPPVSRWERQTRPRTLHLANKEPAPRVWTRAFVEALGRSYDLDVISGCQDWEDERVAEAARECEVVLTSHGSRALPASLAMAPGRMRYVCHLNGSLRGYVPRELIAAGVRVTNWGDSPALVVAEGTLCLLLACAKNIRPHIDAKEAGGWVPPAIEQSTASIADLRLGYYGFGAIGRKFHELVAPWHPRTNIYDPYVSHLPPGTSCALSLEELFLTSDAVLIFAALNDETRMSVNAEMLANLPDGGILVNTARGGLVDHDALFQELATGRLRAGLDVVDVNGRDWMPGHPAVSYSNLILTGHRVALAQWPPDSNRINTIQRTCLENLQRYFSGMPLLHVVDLASFDRST